MKDCHLRAVRELFKNSQPERKSFFDFGTLLSKLQLLQFFDVLVQFQVIQNDGDEQAEHNLQVKVGNYVLDQVVKQGMKTRVCTYTSF